MSVKKKIVYVVLFVVGFAAPFVFIDLCFLNGAIKGSINRIFFTPVIIKNHHFIPLDSAANPDEQRVKFMFAYQSKQGFYGLKKTNLTPEGEPIVFYAAADNGDLSMFVDYTVVEHSPRKFVKKEVDSVSFEPVDVNNPAGRSKSCLKFSLKSGESKKM